ncbi:hypothetical protein VM1G_07359 [Cytospora mali]|uniref:Xylanolytic transcriptional activator regulatory domain-containing protein n=1 Tax=Cytospora mali TaxID=578113 RepID=A0A194W485_CYTMA|nr:hypothetical protein VM1G_07359 [Valsa mali]
MQQTRAQRSRRLRRAVNVLAPDLPVTSADVANCGATRGVRGPKKGYLKALKNRVVQLEALLDGRLKAQQQQEEVDQTREQSHVDLQQAEQQRKQQQQQQQTNSVRSIGGDDVMMMTTPPGLSEAPALPTPPSLSIPVLPTPPIGVVDATTFDFFQVGLSAGDPFVSQPEKSEMLLSASSFVPDLSSLYDDGSPHVSLPDTQLHISAVVQAELDQLYFDRVHPSIPILHQRRYLSWSRSSTKRSSRTCLQYAMWTLAALLSAQYRDMVDPLYSSTRQILEPHGIEGTEPGGSNTELSLAWVLVALCESMRTLHRQAWMSAGRAIRMVQGLRFHEIDSPKNSRKGRRSLSAPGTPEVDDFTDIEQRRRIFWMAYFLDHLLSIRNDWPVTLNEHVICTRLPVPDLEFQTGQHVLGDFLSEAMTEPNPKVRAPLNECLIMVTICGRILLRGQQNVISEAYGDLRLDCAEQRWWLDGMLTTRLQVLSQCYPSPAEAYDPLLLFAHLLAPASVVYYCKGMIESLTSPGDQMAHIEQALEYQHRALGATATIIRLAKGLSELHFSKASQSPNGRDGVLFC